MSSARQPVLEMVMEEKAQYQPKISQKFVD